MHLLFPPYQELSRFSGNLATCHETGLALVRSLETSGQALTRTSYREAVEAAIDRVRAGEELSTALDNHDARWPPFFIPLLEAGERTARLDEALRYLERHCRLLAGPARAVRNAWLYPLCILLFGTAVRLVLHVLFDSWGGAFDALISSLKGYALLGLCVVPFVAPPFKPLVDPVKLALPGIGAVERELGLNRFFSALAMLYSAGGQRVEAMIRFASQAIPNLAVRDDLLKTVREIERGETIAEAFRVPMHLIGEEKGMIAAGDISGTLEQSFDRIADATGESLEFRLALCQTFSIRLTMFTVVLSIAFTMLGLLNAVTSR